MKKITLLSFLALAFAAHSAYALTVKAGEVANKMREVSLQEVRMEAKPTVVLADAKGISLYTFDADSEGKSNCSGGCLSVWPPLNIAADTVAVAPFGKIMGNNGKPQLTLKGLPLYYFKNDKVPGDIKGHYPQWQLVIVENQALPVGRQGWWLRL